MSVFTPTWLYIKQHNQTGLKYFGKTIRNDPYKYPGSGTYWRNHLKIHGNDVTTVWCKLFTDQVDLIEFAMEFSLTNDITNSKDWANILLENGLTGTVPGRKMSESTKAKLRDRIVTDETRQKMSMSRKGTQLGCKNNNYGHYWSQDQKDHMSKINKGRLVGSKNPSCYPEVRKKRALQWVNHNPSKGKSWITTGDKEMLVFRDELSKWYAAGWVKGRVVTQKMRDTMSMMRKGNPPWNKKKRTD